MKARLYGGYHIPGRGLDQRIEREAYARNGGTL